MNIGRFEWDDFYAFIIAVVLLVLIALKLDEGGKLVALEMTVVGWILRGRTAHKG